MDKFYKQSAETLDYDFVFTNFMPEGDTIVSSTITADAGVTLGPKLTASVANGDHIVKQYVSDGTNGSSYKITCLATTLAGRVKELELMLVIKDI